MEMHHYLLLLVCITGILLSSHTAYTADNIYKTTKLRQGPVPSPDRYNFFDIDLFQEVNRMQKEGNILISPLSVKIALSIVMEGAKGETAEEIRTALRLPNDGLAAKEAFGKMIKSLQNRKSKSTLEIANHLFLSNVLPLDEAFNRTVRDNYNAEVTQVDFKDGQTTANLVNAWADYSTHGLIPQLVSKDDLSPTSKMLLTNAVYFKGQWADPFKQERTTFKCFYNSNNMCKHTHMMSQTGPFNHAYISTLDAHAVDMPYEDGKFSMLVVLPRKRDGMQQLGRDLVHVHHENVLAQLERKDVFLQLPRFQINFHDDLVEPIAALHVTKAFGPQADLSGISNESLSLGQIIHSSKIIVNEEGSEAAAITGAVFVPLIGNSASMFIADHPFFFSIRDTATGSILFAGRMSQPEDASLEAALIDEFNLEEEPKLPENIQTVPPPVNMRPLPDGAPGNSQTSPKKPGKPDAPPAIAGYRPGGFQTSPKPGAVPLSFKNQRERYQPYNSNRSRQEDNRNNLTPAGWSHRRS